MSILAESTTSFNAQAGQADTVDDLSLLDIKTGQKVHLCFVYGLVGNVSILRVPDA